MMGLESILRGDSEFNFILLSVESGPSTYILDYVRELYKNHADPSKYQIHVVSFANNFLTLKNQPNVVLYDFLHEPFTTLGDFQKKYTTTRNFAVKNILVIDDLQLFLLNTEKDFGRVKLFLTLLSKTCQIISVFNRDTSSSADLKFFYSQADAVATLSMIEKDQFLCNIVKIKYSGKVVHEKTSYSIVNGKVQETVKETVEDIDIDRNKKILSAITTFKLTLEDEEKESKDRLHLPYFNAQSSKVPDPDFDLFDDEDDEEDEEI